MWGAQLVSACSPHPHYGFEGYVGRGAPEMDILEAMPGYGEVQQYAPTPIRKPYFSTSFQVEPCCHWMECAPIFLVSEVDKARFEKWLPGRWLWRNFEFTSALLAVSRAFFSVS